MYDAYTTLYVYIIIYVYMHPLAVALLYAVITVSRPRNSPLSP